MKIELIDVLPLEVGERVVKLIENLGAILIVTDRGRIFRVSA